MLLYLNKTKERKTAYGFIWWIMHVSLHLHVLVRSNIRKWWKILACIKGFVCFLFPLKITIYSVIFQSQNTRILKGVPLEKPEYGIASFPRHQRERDGRSRKWMYFWSSVPSATSVIRTGWGRYRYLYSSGIYAVYVEVLQTGRSSLGDIVWDMMKTTLMRRRDRV